MSCILCHNRSHLTRNHDPWRRRKIRISETDTVKPFRYLNYLPVSAHIEDIDNNFKKVFIYLFICSLFNQYFSATQIYIA
jgi:hypothetical protein